MQWLRTGYFPSELAGPTIALDKAGFDIVVTTPQGQAPTMDAVSNDAKWFKNHSIYQESLLFVKKNITTPVALESLTEIELKEFSGVFVPGGHAPMEDLSNNSDVGRILAYFHNNNKPTGLICHGPAALLSAKTNNKWLYEGYKMTAFSTAEEQQEEEAGHLDGHLPFYLDAELQNLGALISTTTPWHSAAIQDRELTTGQNPMSEEAFTTLFLKSITSNLSL